MAQCKEYAAPTKRGDNTNSWWRRKNPEMDPPLFCGDHGQRTRRRCCILPTSMSQPPPTYAYSTETTQFDDALIQHGVITKQQAIVAKGATPEQAQQLLQNEADQKALDKARADAYTWQADLKRDSEDQDGPSDDDDSFLDDDDDFLQSYRAQRFQEMKAEFGQVKPIQRSEWQTQVNQASETHWVVVHLTDPRRTTRMEKSVQEVAQHARKIQFVSIGATEAVEGYPADNLPTLFCYRSGKLQHSLIQIPVETDAENLYQMLQSKGVIDNKK